MPPHILSLPTEILGQILSLLPVCSLLRFSCTSRYSYAMATANLRTLSLGIAPYHPHLPSKSLPHTYPYESWLRIPNMQDYTYNTLFNFQSALVSSLLVRYAAMLQHIDLSVWSLSVPMANALRSLHALKTLALRFDSGSHGRSAHRCHIAAERAEQRKAWEVLAQNPPVWSRRLCALKLENADLSTEQLGVLLAESGECREVVLERCSGVGSEFWPFLQSWRGRERLRVLELSDCGGLLGEETVTTIRSLKGLERLNLYDCQEIAAGLLQRWNEDVWRIADFVPPRSRAQGEDMVIEVDPAYMS
ncbi:hypothetical protein yc1106_09877 [Curvularia clavata]|uniref:F-box domain-containing protein n=1 Tax=Curvularia clavata TaxID=95742 RepID=A0A9Q8ZKZ4_CURCL|nr:hypothetical protein yc1106_09877 [Curvularia clavata]